MKRLYVTTVRLKWKFLVLLATLCCSYPLSFASELPDLGNSSAAVLSPQQEQELGLSIIRELERARAIYQDEIVTEYLRALGYRLIATQGQTQAPFRFFAVQDKSINAFALPGGYIGINTGLIIASESESELAGVIAHEVGHVQQRHIARMYEHMGRVRLSTIAGAIAAMILATQSSEAAQGAIAATLAGSTQAMINYTRDHEKEADYVGIVALSKAGYDPMGMPSFFHRMYLDTRFYGNHIPEYLLTHPLTESRLMAAQSRASSFPYKQVPDSLRYHLVHARVLADSFTSTLEAEQYFAKKIERGNYRHHTGTLYGYVLVLLKQNKIAEALPYLDELIAQEPNQALFQLAYAEAEMAQHHTHAAASRLEQTLLNHPTNQLVLTKYCELLIRTGQADKVIQMLKSQVLAKRTHPVYWSLLSLAYNQAKMPLQAHLSQSQYLKAQGDFTGAAIQLRVAKKMVGLSAQERSQIESELKEITKNLKK